MHDEILRHDQKTILTFDKFGVSRHPNHVSTHVALAGYAKANPERIVFQLKSVPLGRKFLGKVDIIFSLLATTFNRSLVLTVRRCESQWYL